MNPSREMETRVPGGYTSSLKGDTKAAEYRADIVLSILSSRGASCDGSIVDVGCGYGVLLEKLMANGFSNILGVEPIEEVVQNLKARGIRGLVGDLEQGVEEIADDSVDIVSCLEVLEHLYDPKKALEEIHRWLRPGGILVASVPNAYRLMQRLRMLVGNPTSDVSLVGGHIKFFDWSTFPSMVEKSGFEIENQFGEGGLRMRKIVPGYMRLLRSYPHLFAKWIFVVATRK
jgi:2-polyprenyl-3-methyl-5-hydroxy-6-metoxy-1,4-benzoquinol methylase